MNSVRVLLFILSAVLLSGLFGCSAVVDVPPGFEGAEYILPAFRSEGGGFNTDVTLEPGRHVLSRRNSIAIIVDTRPQTWTLENIEVRMKDELNVTFDVTLTTKVKKGHGAALLAVYATKPASDNSDLIVSEKEWYRIVKPVFESVVRTRLSSDESSGIAQKRLDVAADMLATLKEQLASEPLLEHVEFTRLVIGNVDYPKMVDDAIQARAEAQQMLAQKSQELEIARLDADIQRVEAEGVAAAQAIIDQTLTREYLYFLWINALEKTSQSPNTTMVYIPVGTDGMPIMHGVK